MHRRGLLRVGAVAGTAALAGCGTLEGVLGDGGAGGASGWSTYRGDPARSGVRPASAGPGDSPEVAWELTRADLAREFHGVEDPGALTLTGETSWPVVVGGVVAWTTSYRGLAMGSDVDDIDRTARVVAANAEDGSVTWSATLSETASRAGQWFAPVGGDGRLYVPDIVEDDLGLVAYDPAGGEELDRLDLGLAATVSQPLVADGMVYAIESGQDSATLRVFDAGDGTEEWSVEVASLAQPGLPGLTVADGAVWTVARGEPPAFVAYEATDGSERSRIPLTDLPPSIATQQPVVPATPTVVEGGVYAAGGLDYLLQREVTPLVAADADGGERWQYRPPGTDKIDPVEMLLGPDVDEGTAERLREELGLEDGYATLYGYPAVVDGSVLAAGAGEAGGDGPGGLFAVDAETGDGEWATPAGDGGFAPVVAGETVYLVTTAGVDVISTDGTHRGQVELGDRREPLIEYSPALGEGGLFVATQGGIVALS